MNASSSMTKYTAALCLCAAGTIASASVVETGFHREVYAYAENGGFVDEHIQTDSSGHGVAELQQFAGAFGPFSASISNSFMRTDLENGNYGGFLTMLAVADYGGVIGTNPLQSNGYTEMSVDFTIHGTETYSFITQGLFTSLGSLGNVYMAIENISSPNHPDRVFLDLTISSGGVYVFDEGFISRGTLTDGDYRFVVRSSMDIDTTLDNNNTPGYGGETSFDFNLAITTNSVPVPSTMAILGLGGLTCARRRR